MARNVLRRLLYSLLLLSASAADAGPADWAPASDLGRTSLVAIGIGAPALDGDWTGAK